MADAKPVKLLLAGDVGGALTALFKRVEAVNAKNGPFDLLLCVGGFFPPGGDPEAEPPADALAYFKGDAQPPVPTYFVGAYGHGSKAALRAMAAAGGKCGLHYLGRGGVVDLCGLNVAFLDGRRRPRQPRQQQQQQQQQQQLGGGGGDGDNDNVLSTLPPPPPDANDGEQQQQADDGPPPGPGDLYYGEADLEAARTDIANLAGDVDVLLTCEWPVGVLRALPGGARAAAAAIPGFQPGACTAAAAELAALARPRYHAAGGQGAFYARPPYANADLGAGARATRFVGLAHVGNAGKHKSLHALALVPAARMAPEQLAALPEGVMPSPFDDASGGGGGGEGGGGGKRAADDGGDGQAWSRWAQPNKRQRQQQGGGGGGGANGAAAAGGGGDGRGQQHGPSDAPVAAAWGNASVTKDNAATVYVKNLPFSATLADVEGLFSRAGVVVDVRRGIDDHGRPKSWAHVQFDTAEAAGRALCLNGADLLGRALTVEATAARPARAHVAPPPAAPVDDCWFCLSSPQVDVALVASVGDEAYVALDKGQIAPTHALVVPVEHYPAFLTLPPAAGDEVLRYLSALRAAFAADGLALVGFERHSALRGRGGNHAHVNVVGVPAAAAAGAREAFESAAREAGFELAYVPAKAGQPDRAALAALAGRGEYFLGLLPDGGAVLRVLSRGERMPMQLGRQVLATLVGAPDRADWRACAKASPAEEEREAERFKAMFKPFDPTLR